MMTLTQERDLIVRELERRFEVPPGSVMGHRRWPSVSRCRWAAWAMLKALHPELCYECLGYIFNRHHSTIMYGLARYFGFHQGRKMAKLGMGSIAARGHLVMGDHLRFEGELILARAKTIPALPVRPALHAIAA